MHISVDSEIFTKFPDLRIEGIVAHDIKIDHLKEIDFSHLELDIEKANFIVDT